MQPSPLHGGIASALPLPLSARVPPLPLAPAVPPVPVLPLAPAAPPWPPVEPSVPPPSAGPPPLPPDDPEEPPLPVVPPPDPPVSPVAEPIASCWSPHDVTAAHKRAKRQHVGSAELKRRSIKISRRNEIGIDATHACIPQGRYLIKRPPQICQHGNVGVPTNALRSTSSRCDVSSRRAEKSSRDYFSAKRRTRSARGPSAWRARNSREAAAACTRSPLSRKASMRSTAASGSSTPRG